MSTEISALSRLSLLVVAIHEGAMDAYKADDSRRRGIINCACADLRMAQGMWLDGRVTGLRMSRLALAETSHLLVSAAKGANALARAAKIDQALKKIVVARNEITAFLARCSQVEEVADAC